MAEGGDLPSLKDGSDADFELTCTPCEEGNIREEAVKHCPECQEYLCTACTMHHGRQKATRTHKLLERDEAKKGSLVAKTKCHYHPDREIEMYCGKHDMVYCVMCIATEHRLCEGVNRIEDESKSLVDQTEINHVLDETRNATDRIKALIIKQQKNKTSLEEQRNHIEDKLEKDEIRLIEHIRKLKRETSESLDKSYADMNGELESEISVSTYMIQNLKKTSEQLQSIAGMDAVQQFVQMKLMKKTVTEANKLHVNSESNGTKSVYFTENTDLINLVMEAFALGKVRTRAEDKTPSKPIQYKMKSKKEINVMMANDKSTCQLPDGMILLTDQANNKVKRLDMNYSIKDYCDLVGIPTGICCIDKNEVAVKLYNDKIQFISVGSTLSKTRCITIVGGNYYGMTLYAEDL
ncbi:E3 ubiquitin-protein ligase TRIM71-like [Mercenaria mercenaria]|uniref:E3 ubiquitin-protein ligase TRIM71-like n=1 Tax=Mercenaria mercenaria TaxID=6596 RepID=UPI00234F0E28|nr:E3 ubiquitin-protein ligase TRIM71-like [Mercenaria mercenaria]